MLGMLGLRSVARQKGPLAKSSFLPKAAYILRAGPRGWSLITKELEYIQTCLPFGFVLGRWFRKLLALVISCNWTHGNRKRLKV